MLLISRELDWGIESSGGDVTVEGGGESRFFSLMLPATPCSRLFFPLSSSSSCNGNIDYVGATTSDTLC